MFFLPLLLGGIPALMLISQIAIFQRMESGEMLHYFSHVVGMYVGVLAFNALLYFALRKRFFREMRMG